MPAGRRRFSDLPAYRAEFPFPLIGFPWLFPASAGHPAQVNDFLLESTDDSSPRGKRSRSNVGSRSSGQHSLDGDGSGETGGESSRSGGGQSGFGVCSKDEMEDFFRSSSSSSSSDDSGGNLYEGGRDKCGGVLLGGGSMEQSRVLVERQEERRHRRLSKRTPRRRNEPLSPLRSLSKEDRRCETLGQTDAEGRREETWDMRAGSEPLHGRGPVSVSDLIPWI